MENRTIQDLMRRIVLPPDTAAETGSPANGRRIGAGVGTYYYDGRENADGSTADPGEGKNSGSRDKEDEDGGGGGSGSSDDPRRDPSDADDVPKEGDDVGGLKDLKDCNTGRCVNVNFTLPPKPPSGWKDACTPPEYDPNKPFYIWEYQLSKAKAWWPFYEYDKVERTEGVALSLAQLEGVLSGFFGEYYTRNGDSNPHKGADGSVPSVAKQRHDCGSYSLNFRAPGRDGFTHTVDTIVYYVCRIECGKNNQGKDTCKKAREQREKEQQWPEYACSEIVSTAGGFKPACADKDPYLPDGLKGEYSAFALCDKNGNPVTIERHNGGWRYTTATHQVTVSADGIAQSVRRL